MNYLAHAYLSFDHPGILVGNMISDFVKGKKKYSYPLEIQKGIKLHREIDRFTDSHPACHDAKKYFRPVYRLYSGAIVDVLLDHFLATDNSIFNKNELTLFSAKTYSILDQYTSFFPEKFNNMYPYMKSQNWLLHYKDLSGIKQSLYGLVRRSQYMGEVDTAFNLFRQYYNQIGDCYRAFIPEIKHLALNFLDSPGKNENSINLLQNT